MHAVATRCVFACAFDVALEDMMQQKLRCSKWYITRQP